MTMKKKKKTRTGVSLKRTRGGLVVPALVGVMCIGVTLHLLSSCPFASASFSDTGLPPLLFNAAVGQRAHASSYYYAPGENPLFRYKYEPSNAIDGLVMQTSWWSSGAVDEEVFWQLNFTSPTRTIEKLVIRWHGFQTPKEYRVRVSFAGEKFQTLFSAADKSMVWDRVDVFESGKAQSFSFLRIQMDSINTCSRQYECGSTAAVNATFATEEAATPDLPIYGIREVEVWSTGQFSLTNSMKNFMINGRLLFFSLASLLTLWLCAPQ